MFFLASYFGFAGFDGIGICEAVPSTFFSALPHIVGRCVGKGAFTSSANSKPKGLLQRAENAVGRGLSRSVQIARASAMFRVQLG